jgi:hypothetical protein
MIDEAFANRRDIVAAEAASVARLRAQAKAFHEKMAAVMFERPSMQ